MASPVLQAELRARLDRFEGDMKEAGRIADRQVNEIEKAFADANPKLNTTALVGSLAAIAGGFGIEKFLETLVQANRQMAELAENAQRVGVSLDRFQEIRFAANVFGIGDADVASTLDRVAARLNDAQRNENSLSKLLEENNIKFKDREGKLISINKLLDISADLVRRAATEQDKFKIAEMLGFTEKWVRLLEQGPDALNSIASEARAAGVIIDENTINKAKEFTREWDLATTKWSSGFRASLSEFLPLFDKLVSGAVVILEAAAKAGSIIAGFGRAATGGFEALNLDDLERMRSELRTSLQHPDWYADTEELDKAQKLLEKIEQRINAIRNQNAEREDQGNRGAPLRITVTGTSTRIPATDRGGSGDRDPFERQADQIERRRRLLEAETATLGQNEAARARARVEAELFTAAERAGIPITDELRERIARLSDEYAKTAQRAETAREIMEGTRELGSALSDAFKSAVIEGKKLDEVLRSLLSRLSGRAIDRLFDIAFRALGSSLIPSANPLEGAFSPGQWERQHGGPVWPGQAFLVGERGPELFVPNTSGQIVPNMPRGAGGALSFAFSTNIDARGADAGVEARLRVALAASEQRTIRHVKEALPTWQARHNALGKI